MENNESLSNNFKDELEAATATKVLQPAYRKRKLILWIIRTAITVVLYVIFWQYSWVRWSLVVTIPLSVISLMVIMVLPSLLKRKIERTKRRIEELDKPTSRGRLDED